MTQTLSVPIVIPNEQLADFCRRWGVVELALFGSVLRADFNPASDIDMLVTFAPGTVYTLAQLSHMQDELATIFGREVDLLDKQAVQASPNYIRRRAILDTTEVIYAQ